jgi:hypothetical protein
MNNDEVRTIEIPHNSETTTEISEDEAVRQRAAQLQSDFRPVMN